MDENYEITVKWADGRKSSRSGYTWETAQATADFLWEVGADDVIIRCACGECETCIDRATFEGC